MQVLVTGANGFIGVHACAALLDRGHHVIALCHRSRGALGEAHSHRRLRVETGDLMCLDPKAFSTTDIDWVCHLAVRPPGSADSSECWRINVDGTTKLLQFCEQLAVERLVFASSMSVYDFRSPRYVPVDEEHPCEPLQDYGREKLAAEERCREFAAVTGRRIPILRFSGVYGPGKAQGAAYNFATAALQGRKIEIAHNRRIDLVCVDDVVEAIAMAGERADSHGTVTMNIGAGYSTSLRELAEVAALEAGTAISVECGPEEGEFLLDITRAREKLDYKPRSLRQGMKSTVQWVKEKLQDTRSDG